MPVCFVGFGIKILQDKNNKEFLFIVFTNDGKLEIDRETSFDILKWYLNFPQDISSDRNHFRKLILQGRLFFHIVWVMRVTLSIVQDEQRSRQLMIYYLNTMSA